MTRFYEPELTANPDSPFVRDSSNKLVRGSYWTDMPDTYLVMVMKVIGAATLEVAALAPLDCIQAAIFKILSRYK